MFIEFPEVSGVISLSAETIKLPEVRRVRQLFCNDSIENIESHLEERLRRQLADGPSLRGRRVCITAGSRGIPHFPLILRTVCRCLKELGAEPFIIPAMGSHGGATAEGQKQILTDYGITEEAMGVPVCSSMEVVQYGTLPDGTPLYCDRLASQADGIVLMNKVKPHTDFRGPHESGLAKMIAIGIAKHKGAAAFHAIGFRRFAEMIPAAAEIFLKTFPVVCGIGIVQNAYDEISELEVAGKDGLMDLDRRLLEHARESMARFKFKETDVLVIDEIGKEISGYGQDPNVTGRANGRAPGFSEIFKADRVFIRGLTAGTHHNGAGLAEADVTTRACLRQVDFGPTWTNLITSGVIEGCKIPMYANNDLEALKLTIACCRNRNPETLRLVRIRNTMALHEIEVSRGLYEAIRDDPEIEPVSDYYTLSFDKEGNLTDRI